MAESTDKTFPWRDKTLAYREAGQGAPLLFLHAFPLSSRMWEGQLAAFSPTHRCLALDFAGFGGSVAAMAATTAMAAGEVSSMEDLADQARILLDHVEAERAVVCGLSMGGYAALAFAAAVPERLAGLILSDTRAGADNEEGKKGRLAMAERVSKEGTGFLPEAMIPKLLGATTRAERPEVVAWVSREIAAATPEGVAAAQRGMAERPDRFAILAKLAVPTLALAGEEDELTPPDESRRMAAALAASQLAILPHAGHLSNLETPEAWNGAVARFLREM